MLNSLKLIQGLFGVLEDPITSLLIFSHFAPCLNHLAFLDTLDTPKPYPRMVDLQLVSPPWISCKHLNLQNIWTKQGFIYQKVRQ